MHSNEDSGVPEGVSAFLGKLRNMIEDPATDHLITWNDTGRAFTIKDPLEFIKQVLPKYYKHNNLASFVRQLNMYGFHKVTSNSGGGMRAETEKVEFVHPFFVKGEPALMQNIRRKLPTGAKEPLENNGRSTIMVSDTIKNLLKEVNNLRGQQQSTSVQLNAMKQENEMLWREISSLRHKHATQQNIVNKLIRFLVSLAHPESNGVVKRKYPPMIKDARVNAHNTENEYRKRRNNTGRIYKKRDSSPGPIIHEIHPSDVLVEDVIEVSDVNSVDLENEFATVSPTTVLSTSDLSNASPETASIFNDVTYPSQSSLSPQSVNSVGSHDSYHRSTPSPHFVVSNASPPTRTSASYRIQDSTEEELMNFVEQTETGQEEEYITVHIDPYDMSIHTIEPSYPKGSKKRAIRRKSKTNMQLTRNRTHASKAKASAKISRSSNKAQRTKKPGWTREMNDEIDEDSVEYILGVQDLPDIAAYEIENTEKSKSFGKSKNVNKAQKLLSTSSSRAEVTGTTPTPLIDIANARVSESGKSNKALKLLPTASSRAEVTSMTPTPLIDIANARVSESGKSNQPQNQGADNLLNFDNLGDFSSNIFLNYVNPASSDVTKVTSGSDTLLSTSLPATSTVPSMGKNMDNMLTPYNAPTSIPMVNMGYNGNIDVSVLDDFLRDLDKGNFSVSSNSGAGLNHDGDSTGRFAWNNSSYANLTKSLDSVQSTLDNVKEQMRREGLHIDEDMFHELMLPSTSQQDINEENKPKVEGNEVVSYPYGFNNNGEMLDVTCLGNPSYLNQPVTASADITNFEDYCSLRTPDLTSPIPSKIMKLE